MKKHNWIWMPHAAHFICGNDCRFVLATYVGRYIVSTVGEYYPDEIVRRIHAQCHDKEWFEENKDLKGDNFAAAYMKRFGFEKLGMDRTYETMVFKAKKSKEKCCPYVCIVEGGELDFLGYNSPEKARKGHLKLCEKWAQKQG